LNNTTNLHQLNYTEYDVLASFDPQHGDPIVTTEL